MLRILVSLGRKTQNQTVLSACEEVGHLMVLNLTVLKRPSNRMHGRLMFTNNFHNAFHLDCSYPGRDRIAPLGVCVCVLCFF